MRDNHGSVHQFTSAMTILTEASADPGDHTPSPRQAIEATQRWLEKAVIGLNLCPFAKAVHVRRQIRYALSTAVTTEELYLDLVAELETLQRVAPDEIDTTLLIHPWVLSDFLDYNDFLDIADTALEELGLDGEIQIASFHPNYQFADTQADDISNYTNRSPYPILHLLREASIDHAVTAFPDAGDIFNRNIEIMERLGHAGWNALDVDAPVPLPCQFGKTGEN